MPPKSFGWTCSNCTYNHHAPGERCVMCHELRVTRQQMRNFVKGIPVPKDDGPPSAAAAAACPQPKKQQQLTATVLRNPYSKKSGISSSQLMSQSSVTSTNSHAAPTAVATIQTTIATATTGARTKTTKKIASTSTTIRSGSPSLLQQQRNNNNNNNIPMTIPKRKSSGANKTKKQLSIFDAVTMAVMVNSAAEQPQTARMMEVHENMSTTAGGVAVSSSSSVSSKKQPTSHLPPKPATTSVAAATSNKPTITAIQSSRPISSSSSSSSLPAPQGNVSTTSSHHHVLLQHVSLQTRQQQQPQHQSTVGLPPAPSSSSSVAPNPFTIAAGVSTKIVPNKSSQKQQQQQQQGGELQLQQLQPQQLQRLPRPSLSTCLPFRPGPVSYDPDTIHTWIYPVGDDFPTRQYQLEIATTAMFHNTLVSLPTGLGKTLIAAVVMYNYHRWFAKGGGKIIFMAPTLPLVQQQVKACYQIMGLSETATAVMTGKLHPKWRQKLWQTKSVFYGTPETVQRDLESGRLPPHQVVCVVLDEAHRASGKYAYCKVLEALRLQQQQQQQAAQSETTTIPASYPPPTATGTAAAPAQFRLLGLSATPGANIRAIQSVIDVLQVSKIEARSEEHPSVAPYTHKRESEIILVDPSTSAKEAERALNDCILNDLLTKLRNGGFLKRAAADNSAVGSYSVLQAREAYRKYCHCQDPPVVVDKLVFGLFCATHTFIGIREHMQKHGIGLAYEKIRRMRNEPQIGLISKIVKSDEFEKVYQTIRTAATMKNQNPTKKNGETDNEEQSGNSGDDVLRNNPKLMKLVEIMREHFLREAAVGRSSRAIVFSQYRDSVSEIVAALTLYNKDEETNKVVLRPRRFIGQGKSSANSATTTTKGVDENQLQLQDQQIEQQPVQLNGMKQSEQQKVIQEFRSDVHNILVCTCIGEEGLDIGEVDLIVNFDTLRNPIRMLQRVGRTGRKREGRVVCLVMRGAEEKNLLASHQAKNTLAHALESQKSFKLHPGISLFPGEPQLIQSEMKVNAFQMSQVEGHGKRKLREKKVVPLVAKSKLNARGRPAAWRLTPEEKEVRLSVFGKIEDKSAFLPSSFFEEEQRMKLLRRRFLLGRGLSSCCTAGSSSSTKPQSTFSVGPRSSLIRFMEGSVAIKSRPARVRKSRGYEQELDHVFPLIQSASSSAVAPTAAEEGLDLSSFRRARTTEGDCSEKMKTESVHTRNHHPAACNEPSGPCQQQDAAGNQIADPSRLQPAIHCINPYKQSFPTAPFGNTNMNIPRVEGGQGAATGSKPKLIVNPYGKKPLHSSSTRDVQPVEMRENIPGAVDVAETNHSRETSELKISSESPVAQKTNPHENSSGCQPKLVANPYVKKSTKPQIPQGALERQERDDSALVSSSLGASTFLRPKVMETTVPSLMLPQQNDTTVKDDVFRLPTPPDSSSSEDDESNDDDDVKTTNSEKDDTLDSFCLPTPPDSSSSSEDESDDDHGNGGANVHSCRANLDLTAAPVLAAKLLQDGIFREQNKDVICAAVNAEEIFRLPTQEESSSSSEEEEWNVDDNDAKQDVSAQNMLPMNKQVTNANEKDNPSEQYKINVDNDTSAGASAFCSQRGTGRSRFSGEANLSAELFVVDDPLDETPQVLPKGRKGGRKLLAIEDTPESSLGQLSAPRRRIAVRKTLAIEDTPECDNITREDKSKRDRRSSFGDALMDSEAENDNDDDADVEDNLDDIVCAVCFSPDDSDENPIVLCDGPKIGVKCNFAVHMSCYSISKTLAADAEWRCDPCRYRYTGGTDPLFCCKCNGKGGVLRQADGNMWNHLDCSAKRVYRTGHFKKLGKIKHKSRKAVVCPPKQPTVVDLSGNSPPDAFSERKRRRTMHYRRFLDEEAAIRSEDDMDGDECEADDIDEIEREEAELYGSFINDSSQLGFTQGTNDGLFSPDDVYHDEDNDSIHRELDAERERLNEFATPILNRRHKRRKEEGKWTDTPDSAPSSQKGLGNMHFIRSILDHHRQGGNCDDVEEVYAEMEEEEGPIDEEALVPQRPDPVRTVLHYQESDSEVE